MADADRPGPPVPAIPLLIFAAIDIAFALLILAGEGFTLGFLVVGAIGLTLAGIGLWGVFSRVAYEHTLANPDAERKLPGMLERRRRRSQRR
jgi:hypothetical protein